MRRLSSVLGILVIVLLMPASGFSQSPMKCIRLERHEFYPYVYRNVCARDVILGWCFLNIALPGGEAAHPEYNLCHMISRYYYTHKTFTPGEIENAQTEVGKSKWAACFAPKRPVAVEEGRKFICR